MKKTMYIPKGQECRFEDLTCERIVVEGSLHVDGKIKTKHISGNGFLYARSITASTVKADTIEADYIDADEVLAARIDVFSIIAVHRIAVSSLIKAIHVETRSITYATAEIKYITADEVIKLSPKNRSLLRTLFLSFIRSQWTALMYDDPSADVSAEDENESPDGEHEDECSDIENENECPDLECENNEAETGSVSEPEDKTSITLAELEETARLLNDSEFLRIRAMYRLAQEMGGIWQLVPKREPADKVVIPFQPSPAA